MSVIETPLSLELFGFSTTYSPGRAWETGSPFMDRLWREVKANQLPNKGNNIWVYEGARLFVGLEFEPGADASSTALEHKQVILPRYVTATHRGPYAEMKATYGAIDAEIAAKGLERAGVSVEIYGHDQGPGSLPEVELIVEVKKRGLA